MQENLENEHHFCLILKPVAMTNMTVDDMRNL